MTDTEARATEPTPKQSVPVLAACPLGGYAPCVDDMCHSSSTTLCGLEWGEDFCHHGYLAGCPQCPAEDDSDEEES